MALTSRLASSGRPLSETAGCAVVEDASGGAAVPLAKMRKEIASSRL